MLRDHSKAIFGAFLGLLFTFTLAVVPGCMKTQSLLDPNRKVNAAELQQEAATITEQQSAEGAALQASIATYNAKVAAENAKLKNAADDIANQQQILNKVATVLGGAAVSALKGGFDPQSLLGTALTMVASGGAIGSLLESSKKAGIIATLRQQQPPTPTPPDGPAVPFIIPKAA